MVYVFVLVFLKTLVGQASCAILRIAPLFPVALGLIGGIILDEQWTLSRWIYGGLFLAATVVAVSRRMRMAGGAFLVLSASLCVGGALHAGTREIPATSIERYTTEAKRLVRIRGVVVSKPRLRERPDTPFKRWTFGSDRTVFLLAVVSVQGEEGPIDVTGRVHVTIDEAVLDLRENERVELFGWLYRLRSPRNPGGYDWASRNRRQGVVARVRCKSAGNMHRLDPNPPQDRDILAWLRTTARGMLTDDLATGSDEEASLLEAMVLGHRSGLDRRLNGIFIRAGCIHFLAVSGVHVGIVMFFVWWACQVLGLRRNARALAMMAGVILYAAVTEPRPPILRASVISLVYCVSLLLRRERSYLNWISICAVVLAVFDPAMVFDLGYQLSFTAVLGVSYLHPALVRADLELRMWWSRVVRGRPFEQQDRALALALGPRRARVLRIPLRVFRRGWPFLVIGFAVSLSAWLITVPLIAVYFHRIHLLGPLASVFVLPVVSVSMLLGFAKLLAGIISPTVGSAIGWALSVVDGALLLLVERLATVPGATVAIEAPPWWVTTSFYLFLALLVWGFPRERRVIEEREADPNIKPVQPPSPGPRRAQRRACLVALLVLVAATITWQWPPPREDRLVVTVLSVGAGTATVIELPDGRTVLYDAGSSTPSDIGRNIVVPFLRHRSIEKIDRVYLSHANLDHFSGLPTIVSQIQTGPIIVNRYFEERSGPRSPSRHLLKLLADRNHPVQAVGPPGGSWTLSGVTFEYLAPAADFPKEVATNDTSTVLRVTYGGHSILFTGDIEERALRALIERGNVNADVLLLPHHGGVKASTPAFIRAVDPSSVIRSSAEPMSETLNGLPNAVGRIPLYNTADIGAVQIVIQRADEAHYELRIASIAPKAHLRIPPARRRLIVPSRSRFGSVGSNGSAGASPSPPWHGDCTTSHKRRQGWGWRADCVDVMAPI